MLAFTGPVGDPLTASRFESSCDYSHSEAAKYCMWGETMPHSNFQHVFCHQRFYILIKKEHKIKTSDTMSMAGGRTSRNKPTQGCFISSMVWTKGIYTKQPYEVIQDISGTKNGPVMVMAGNLIVIEGSKFVEYFNSEFYSKLSREVQTPTLSKRTFHITAFSGSYITAHPLCQHAVHSY